jgi:hypothetical protein
MSDLSSLPVRIYESELKAIALEASKHKNIETGGDLYGLWTHGDRPVIFLASGPGPRARAAGARFQQDYEYIMDCEKLLYETFGIQYLGDWHSHHDMNLPSPSGGDIERIHSVAANNFRKHMVEIIVTHVERQKSPWGREQLERINVYLYPDAQKDDPLQIQMYPMKGESPIRTTLAAQRRGLVNLLPGWQSFPYDRILLRLEGGIQEPEASIRKLMGRMTYDGCKYEVFNPTGILFSVPSKQPPGFISFMLAGSPLQIVDIFYVDQRAQKHASIKDQLELAKFNDVPNSIEVAIHQIEKKGIGKHGLVDESAVAPSTREKDSRTEDAGL